MIYGDISEKKEVHEAFKKRLGENYQIKELGLFDCKNKKILLKIGEQNYCASVEETPILIDSGFTHDGSKSKCTSCPFRSCTRFADFEIAEGRAYYERKTASDFISSRKDRLYSQLNLLDTFVEDGHKGLILEGIEDKDSGFFSGVDKVRHDIRGMSPLKQAIEIGGKDKENWTLSFIRECKMRNIEFVQTWNLEETITFLEQCDEGYDIEPKTRVIPKRYPDIPLEQNILVLFDGIGKATSEKYLKKYKKLGKLITVLRKMSKEEAQKDKVMFELWKVLHWS